MDNNNKEVEVEPESEHGEFDAVSDLVTDDDIDNHEQDSNLFLGNSVVGENEETDFGFESWDKEFEELESQRAELVRQASFL
jgi:hypothetical protein